MKTGRRKAVDRRFAVAAAAFLRFAFPLVFTAFAGPTRADFLRGDANFDSRVNVSDAVVQIQALFHDGSLPCQDAADANDDGKVSLEDALKLLQYLFIEGKLPSPGTLLAGADPTCDELGCEAEPDSTPVVVLSEVLYHPLSLETGEFIEIHNRSAEPVSLAGYRFTRGIEFAFPDDAFLPPFAYGLVLRDPSNPRFRQLTGPKFGPFQGSLANGGERITLANNWCSSETVNYADLPPWPIGADIVGSSLERIDELTAAEDVHAWRSSLALQGTPGAANSTAGIHPRPMVLDAAVEPASPTSRDTVKTTVLLDEPADSLRKVVLRWEAAALRITSASVEMTLSESGPAWSVYAAQLPPQPSQSLVRMNFQVERTDGRSVVLPHPADPGSFTSYFVYDSEVPAKLPILWLFPKRRTGLHGPVRTVSGAAVLEPGAPAPLVFDGADLRTSRQGLKLKFIKGQDYRGDRTVNITPEAGGGGTGTAAPHMEQMGFFWFRELGALAPRADWFRVVDYGNSGRHSQRLVIQEINQRFLEMNGLSPDGDLYKYVYQGNEKHTNLETGMKSLNDLLAKLGNARVRSETVRNELDLENVGLYSLVSVLIANWDGFHNNLYLYNDLTPGARWKVIPWDLDQVFEINCQGMPVTRPLTGEGCNARSDRRPLADPYHREPDLHQAYLQALRDAIAPDGPFNPQAVKASLDEVEKLLLDDVEAAEAYLGTALTGRRSQIRGAYAGMRSYVDFRVKYLKSVLGM